MTTFDTLRRFGSTGVHSINRFVFSVPDLEEAQRFYGTFGLDVRGSDGRLEKGILILLADSLTMSLACFLVPTNKIFFPLRAICFRTAAVS